MQSLDRRAFLGGLAIGALGLPSLAATPPASSSATDGIQVLTAFDGGMAPPFTLESDTITFECTKSRLVNVLVCRAPARLRVRLLLTESEAGFIATQGLIVSVDGGEFAAAPLTKTANGAYEATLDVPRGEVRLATRYPYGRDGLDRLLCDTSQTPNTRWRYLSLGSRGIPMFELGHDDGRKPIHFLFAGEDAWETAGQWVADAMVRALCADRALADQLSARALIRIVPLTSPYSTTQPGNYTGLDGKGFYGAAHWADPEPPPEIALLRREVEDAIARKRLGFMMTIHSWQAKYPDTGMQTIQSAGANTLSPARIAWAKGVLDAMIKGVPKGKVSLPEKIWYPGLARDYLLARHNAVTFRVEITTRGQGIEVFRQTGRRFIENLGGLTVWGPVLNP